MQKKVLCADYEKLNRSRNMMLPSTILKEVCSKEKSKHWKENRKRINQYENKNVL